MSEATTPLRVAIYGSCVSRDTVEFAGRSAMAVQDYVARQSLLSAGSDASALFPESPTTSSSFQERMIRSDFAGDLGRRLEAVAPRTDLLLWDIVDERHGVHLLPDGRIITRSIDVVQVPETRAVAERGRHIAFGSDEHWDRWVSQARCFMNALDRLGLRSRTVALQIPWALATSDGRPTPPSMGITAKEANELTARYFSLQQEMGIRIIRVPEPMVFADTAHKWGLAPFHYSPHTYQRVVAELRETCAAGCGPRK